MLGICMEFSKALPAECANTAEEAWKMLDGVLSRHGNVRSVCDVTCNLLRVGVDFFNDLARPLAPAIISRLTQAWQLTNLSSYVWATSKMARLIQQPNSADPVYAAIEQAFNMQSQTLFEFFASHPMSQNEDGERWITYQRETDASTLTFDCSFFCTVVEDYLIFLDNLMHQAPDIVIFSSHLPSTLAFISSSLGSVDLKVIRRSVDYLLSLLGHDVFMVDQRAKVSRPEETEAAIRNAVQQTGFSWVTAMLKGMISDYEDTATCVTAFRSLAAHFPAELAQWVPAALQQVSPKVLSQSDRDTFLAQFGEGMSASNLQQVRNAFLALERMSKKAKRRQWEEGRSSSNRWCLQSG